MSRRDRTDRTTTHCKTQSGVHPKSESGPQVSSPFSEARQSKDPNDADRLKTADIDPSTVIQPNNADSSSIRPSSEVSTTVANHLQQFDGNLRPCALRDILTRLYEDYVLDPDSDELSPEETAEIEKLYARIRRNYSLSDRSRFRTKYFWRFRAVGLALHLHPTVKPNRITADQVRQLMDGLVKAVYKVFARSGADKAEIGFSIYFDEHVLHDDEGNNPYHFHVCLLPFRLPRDEAKALRANPAAFLRRSSSRGWRAFSFRAGDSIRPAMKNRWAHENLLYGDEFRGCFGRLDRLWQGIQKKVFKRRLRKEQLVFRPDYDSFEGVWAKNFSDAIWQWRYHHQQLKVETNAWIKSLPEKGMVQVRSRRTHVATVMDLIEFYRRHLRRRFGSVKARTFGLLRNDSPFRFVLDRMFSVAESCESILYWATLPRRRLLWELQQRGPSSLRWAAMQYEFDQLWKRRRGKRGRTPVPDWTFAGDYAEIPKYLRWLADNPPEERTTRPEGLMSRVTLKNMLDSIYEDERYVRETMIEVFPASPDINSLIVDTPRSPAGLSAQEWEELRNVNDKTVEDAKGRRRLRSILTRIKNLVTRAVVMRMLLASRAIKTQAELGALMGVSRVWVSTTLSALSKLSDDVVRTLTSIEGLSGRRLSWHWLTKNVVQLPKEDQLSEVVQHGGAPLLRELEAADLEIRPVGSTDAAVE